MVVILTMIYPLMTVYSIGFAPIKKELLIIYMSDWTKVNKTETIASPIDVVANLTTVKVLNRLMVGQLKIYTIPTDSWRTETPPPSIGHMSFPSGMCIGPRGSVYISDTGNNRILKCDARNIWSVVIGGGLSSPRGMVYHNSNLYVADYGNDRIRCFTNGVWKTISTNGAALHKPTDVKVDKDGNLVFTDSQDGNVLWKGLNGSIISIISNPNYTNGSTRIFVDDTNMLYLTNYALDKVAKNDGTVFESVMKSGSAIGKVNGPVGIFEDGLGTIYVADYLNGRVQRNRPDTNGLRDLHTEGATVPGFNTDTTSYNVTYPHTKAFLVIGAEPINPYSKVLGDLYDQGLNYGVNTFTVTVDPESGASKVYTINITRETAPTPVPTPEPTTEPTPEPTPEPTTEPTAEPTVEPAEEESSEESEEMSEDIEETADESEEDTAAVSEDVSDDTEDPDDPNNEDGGIFVGGGSKPMSTGMVVILTIFACAVLGAGGFGLYKLGKKKSLK